jgi:hypothetical protein
VLAPDATRVPQHRRSAQQDHPARTDFHRYHCDGCEAARPQEFFDAMRALTEN